MARIRTIKPEFWTDEDVVELDFWERLLFIALWNFADDQGYIPYSPKRIKMQTFPSDDVDIAQGLARLLEADFLLAYDVVNHPGEIVLRVRRWDDHQRISNPSRPRYDVANLRQRRDLTDATAVRATPSAIVLASTPESSALLGNGSSERKGGKEARERAIPLPVLLPLGQRRLLADALIDTWNRKVDGTGIIGVRSQPASMAKVEAAVQAQPELAQWERVFDAMLASDRLMGRTPWTRDGRYFTGLTFWWVLNKADEILAGGYANDRAAASRTTKTAPGAERAPVPGVADTEAMLARLEAGRA